MEARDCCCGRVSKLMDGGREEEVEGDWMGGGWGVEEEVGESWERRVVEVVEEPGKGMSAREMMEGSDWGR